MSLALYTFDGSVRRNKAAEAIVDDLTSRERFLAKINQERDERALEARRHSAAVTIQSCFRSFAARKSVKTELRLAFDHVCAGSKNNRLDVNTLNEQIARLVLFHSPAIDQHRLVWTCQASLAAAQLNGRDAIAASKRFPLYKCCLRHLDQISSDASASFAPALRLLEVFAFVDDAETARLVSVGCFACIRRLFEKRVPLPLDENLEVVDRLPSQMAEGIASSLLRPILALKSVQDESFRQKILRRFCLDVLDGDDPRHVVCYLLPYIGQQVERQLLPFADLLASLLPSNWLQLLNDDRKPSLELKVQSPVLFGYVLLHLAYRFPLEGCTAIVKQMFLLCLSCTLQAIAVPVMQAKDNDDEDEENYMDVDDFASRTPGTPEFLLRMSVHVLQTPKVREALLSAALEPPTPGAVSCLARVCYFVSGHKKRSDSDSALIYSLSFKTEFTRHLWHLIKHCTSPTIFGQPRPLLDNLLRGMPLVQDEKDRLIPLLSLFCSLMINTLLAVHDDEFFKEDNDRPLTSLVPFSIRDLCLVTEKLRNVALGLIDLAFPDSRTDLMPKIGVRQKESTENPIEWNALFDLVVRLLQLLHERDARLQFMAQSFWSNHNRKVVVNRQVFHSRRRGVFRQRERPFAFVRWLTHEEMEGEDGLQPTAVDLRNVTIMRRIPFVVPFLERVQIFQELLNHDKQEINRMDEWGGALHHGDAIFLRVRRNYLYEDAFENLSPVNAPTVKKQIRVSMTNWAGLDEAGIDGGGIFREFLSELLKSGFDPQRGFFTTTPHDRLLYPSPVAVKLFPDDFSRHYYFLGRMLGKLIYENQMAELRFASFFLAKLLHKNDENVDIHHLSSLDPDLYNNLLYVKQYADDVTKLELDFSVVVEHLGQVEKINLKPDGSNIRVDNNNRIEYIHLLANYYLNERLRPATRAMRAGLSDVLDLDWLGMFDHREMQILISGADSDVDVTDMRKFVVIHNVQTDDDHRVVDTFWQVILSFSPVEKRKLLKFVTGCSRPPLMGFKDLYPPMGIQLVPDSDRLPSAATCMNLLKLPKFRDQQTMYTKLVYAIEAGAGFELS